MFRQRLHRRRIWRFKRGVVFFAKMTLLLLAVGACILLAFYFYTRPRTYYVYYGQNSEKIKVEFEDKKLSNAKRSAIVKDLNVCLREMSKRGRFFVGNPEGSKSYYEGAAAYRILLDFHPYFNPRVCVNITPDGQGFQISQYASDTYTNAFAFAAAHSKIVAAGYKFVDFISSPCFANISTNDLRDYVVYDYLSEEKVMREAPRIISYLSNRFIYFPPSILSFEYRKMWSDDEPSYLSMQIPYLFVHGYPGLYSAIWRDGKWKLYGVTGFHNLYPDPE